MPGAFVARARASGRYPSSTKWMSGRSSQSSTARVSWRGNPLTSAAPLSSSRAADRATASRDGSTSTSQKTQVSYCAASASCQQACCLPHHPGGSGRPGTSRTRGSAAARARTICPVPSSLESSSTTSSRRTPSLASTSRQSRPIAAASFRAGTRTETAGPLAVPPSTPPAGARPERGARLNRGRLASVRSAGIAASTRPATAPPRSSMVGMDAASPARLMTPAPAPSHRATGRSARPATRPASGASRHTPCRRRRDRK